MQGYVKTGAVLLILLRATIFEVLFASEKTNTRNNNYNFILID